MEQTVSDVEGARAGSWLVGGRPGGRRPAGRPARRGRPLLLVAAMPALSVVNAGVGLVLPGLLGPARFGEYALATTMFQYGLIFDFGISQVIDRRVPTLSGAEAAAFVNLVLWGRLLIAAVSAVGGVLLLGALAARGALPFGLEAGILSLLAGLAFMLALGPMSIDRAASRRAAFARASAATGCVLAVARPLGIIVGGISGSFLFLLLGYAVTAGVVARDHPVRLPPPPARALARLVAQGVPLFATSFVWAFYMTANRWVVSLVAQPLELGHFAFGSNIVSLLVGMLGALSQFYYPAVVSRVAAGGRFCASATVSRDLSLLGLGLAAVSAAGIVAGPWAIHLAYPGFAGSEAPVRIMLAAVPSLVVSSWLMPLSLSTAARPWIDGALCYPAALVLLLVGTYAGFRLDGIAGAGWGLVASAPALLAFQLGALRFGSLLTGGGALAVLLAALSSTAVLAVLAIRITPLWT